MDEILAQVFQVGFFAALIRIATPLLFATLGELFAERAGVLNLGIEGIMLLAAMTGFSTAFFTGSTNEPDPLSGKTDVRHSLDPQRTRTGTDPKPFCDGTMSRMSSATSTGRLTNTHDASSRASHSNSSAVNANVASIGGRGQLRAGGR